MKVLKVVIISILTAVILIGTVFFLIGYFKPKPGGILVSTNPTTSVYINGSLVGEAPYNGTFDPGEVTIKLVPKGNEALMPFETKITLTSGIRTVVRREFGASEAESSGDIISFEKESGETLSLIVVSTPENAQVSVDGVPRGFAPYRTSQISPAEHQVTVKSPGYVDRVMTVKTIPGFRLTVFAKLAKAEEVKGEEAPVITKTYVEVLTTPTGYLRVRTEPGLKGSEIDQITPGAKYLFLEEDADTGWFKIQLEVPSTGLPNGRSGWVSNRYARKIEETSNSGD